MMASKATAYWRSMMMSRMGGNRRTFASAAEFVGSHSDQRGNTKFPRAMLKGQFVPVYVALGLIILQAAIGFHTVKHHLKNSPAVRLSKKRRETIPEVEDPDSVVDEAQKFISNSFFRKVAHIQDFKRDPAISDPIRGDAFAHPPKADTMKSVGVDPAAH
ncbi:hypothetical protein IFM89_030417 [Coptis chinensis]|uniref:Uncharacterized protein n=1 Tax=Coptis chinensis TaxID=261450 RepID=A0A835LSY7_9MAGN|nr:hypothetical protein IFM89_030417 [Coptis chinensis]